MAYQSNYTGDEVVELLEKIPKLEKETVKITETDSTKEYKYANLEGIESDSLLYALPNTSTGYEDDVLLSKKTVKTINGQDIFGEGNIEVKGGGGAEYDDTEIRTELSEVSELVDRNKQKIRTIQADYENLINNLAVDFDTIDTKHSELVGRVDVNEGAIEVLKKGEILKPRAVDGAISSYEHPSVITKIEGLNDVYLYDEEGNEIIVRKEDCPFLIPESIVSYETTSDFYIQTVTKYEISELREELSKKADIDGVYAGMTVGRSAELLGVAEAQEAEITFRPTDGDGSIKDGFASIERVKGETVVWNQILDANNTTGNNTNLTYSDDIITVTMSQLAVNVNYGGISYILKNPWIIGHKYILMFDDIQYSDNITRITIGNTFPSSQNSLLRNGIVYKELLLTSTISSSLNSAYINAIGTLAEGDTFSIKNLHCHDLTKMFGAGNEPTTIEEFYARIPMGVDLNAYNEGEVVGMTANSLKSVGFNAWDEEWENGRFNPDTGIPDAQVGIRSKNRIKVLPNETYWCTSSYNIFAHFYDAQGNLITNIYNDRLNYLPIKDKQFTTPVNAATMAFYAIDVTTYNHDICIHLVHSGYRNGEYEPYEDDVLALPTNDLFPQGMHGINGVVDEYDAEKKTQRIGVVDMGTLNWYEEDTSTSNVVRFFCPEIENSKGVPSNAIANLICKKYSAVTAGDTYNQKIGVAVKLSGVLSVYDPTYTDAAALKASLQGVLLYYELAEPVITYHDKPLHLTYKAWDFGTEAMQNDKPSTPLKAEIVYEFNARDTIRANKANLEKKQDILVSGKTIKTINGENILGEGDIVIEGGEGSYDDTEIRQELAELSAETNQVNKLVFSVYERTDVVTEVTTYKVFPFSYPAGKKLVLYCPSIGENSFINILGVYKDGTQGIIISASPKDGEQTITLAKELTHIGYYCPQPTAISIIIKSEMAAIVEQVNPLVNRVAELGKQVGNESIHMNIKKGYSVYHPILDYVGSTILVKVDGEFSQWGYYLEDNSYTIVSKNGDWTYLNVPNNATRLFVYSSFATEVDVTIKSSLSLPISSDKLVGVTSNPLETIKETAGFARIFQNWGFIGDSLLSGNHNYYVEGGSSSNADDYRYSWGKTILKMLNCEGEIYANGGQTAKGWISAKNQKGWDKAQTEAREVYVIALGCNDAGNSVNVGSPSDINIEDYSLNADSFYGNYAGIIQRLKSIQKKAIFFLVTLPQGDRTNAQEYNAAIRHMATIFSNVWIIDLWEYAMPVNQPWSQVYRLQYHLNSMGYLYTAYEILTYIDWIIRKNPKAFRDVAFIGTDKFATSDTNVYGNNGL